MDIDPVRIFDLFIERYGSEPLMVQSPARVNLIGEHTDYNDGFVLPASINKKIVMGIAPNKLSKIRLYSLDMEQPEFVVELTESLKKSGLGWPDYIIGVVDQLQKSGAVIEGFDCLFGSDIPIGAGLSSSAALEGAVLTGLNHLHNLGLSALEMAKIGQKAENRFVGVQCGIMDQFANLHGKSGNVIRLDCRTLEYLFYPFKRDDISILLCDTKVRRELAASEYNVRRRQCEEGVEILHQFDPSIKNLRDVSHELLEKHKSQFSNIVYNRCRYVLDENQRVLKGCEDLLKDDIESFGQRMFQSHYGLRDLYDVSCRELDLLVDSAKNLDAVFGARMMGGGFGGCTINLVLEDEIDQVIDTIKDSYENEMNMTLAFYIVRFNKRAGIIKHKVVEKE
jgi:galactokinase